MSVIVDTQRLIVSVLSPLTGTRATGAIVVKALATDVTIPAGTHGVPIIDGQQNYDAMVKTTAAVTATAAGATVAATALIGGAHVNLPVGTSIRWDYPIAGVESVSKVSTVFSGGVGATGFGGVQALKIYEQIGSANVASDLFAAKVGRFPAVILSWDSSREPSDIVTRVGPGTTIFEERWLLSVITSRMDSTEQRRQEGLEILENATDLLMGRTEVDGQVFTGPEPVTIGRRSRIAVSPTSYVYSLEFTTTRSRSRKEWRTFAPWLTSQIQTTTDIGTLPEAVTVNDIVVAMPQ